MKNSTWIGTDKFRNVLTGLANENDTVRHLQKTDNTGKSDLKALKPWLNNFPLSLLSKKGDQGKELARTASNRSI